MVYKFRIVLDTLNDVFRDIEIEADATLEDLHNAAVQAFDFQGTEMASFYLSDENWNQGEEILLFDVSEGNKSVRMMNDTAIDSVVSEKQTKLIYVYDFFNMWTFYVELADKGEKEMGINYPNLMYSHGHMPENPPEKKFEADKEDLEDDLDDDDLGFEDLDDMDFDDQLNWIFWINFLSD